ncbi:MAG: hypothetical protein NC078_10000 [Ruminococcus sp.]|nr:hypothetical protein [Ruminococcus sp.]
MKGKRPEKFAEVFGNAAFGGHFGECLCGFVREKKPPLLSRRNGAAVKMAKMPKKLRGYVTVTCCSQSS